MVGHRGSSIYNIKNRRGIVNISSLCLSLLICLSFLFHYFNGIIFIATFLILTIIYVISKPIFKIKINSISLLWLPAACMILFSFLRSQRSRGSLMDITILLTCILLVLFFSIREEVYERSINIMIIFAIFYAVGVFVQMLFPNFYNLYLKIIPTDLAAKVAKPSSGSYIRGFTTNAGFTAGYICVGIIGTMSTINLSRKKSTIKILLTIFLVVALLYTGKRGHALFLILTVGVFCLSAVKGIEKFKIIWNIFLMLLVSIVIFFLLRDFLVRIPLVNRIIDTINGLIEGEDVTSARSGLYVWAWKLFKENLLLGIGWGDFRTTVVGNVTIVTALDTHNIYLQLLCETGIIGFISVIIPLAVFWLAAKKAYYKCLIDDSMLSVSWRPILNFSFMYQTFFLLYGLTGTVLYDQHHQILYMFSCSIIMAYRFRLNKEKIELD